jgi:predicted  nucleic acid-binding Zn-ribbon protein
VILYRLHQILKKLLELENRPPFSSFGAESKEVKEREKQIKSLSAKIKDLESELSLEASLLKNKEENFKFASQKLKESARREVLIHQKKVNQLSQQITELKLRLNELICEQDSAQQKKEQEEQDTHIQEVVKDLQEELQQIRSLIPSDLFNKFKMAFEHHPANPFAEVLKSSNSCSYCGFKLILEDISLLISKDAFFNCQGCKKLIIKVIVAEN